VLRVKHILTMPKLRGIDSDLDFDQQFLERMGMAQTWQYAGTTLASPLQLKIDMFLGVPQGKMIISGRSRINTVPEKQRITKARSPRV
jgi:hypothetical protein